MMKTRIRRARSLLWGCAILVLALLAEGYAFRSPWEPAARDIDASVKRAQTIALADSRLMTQTLPYRAEYLDERRWYLPFVKPFILRSRGGFQSIFPTMAAVIDVPFEWLGGNAGIRLLSILATVGLTLVVGARAGLRRDAYWPLVLGFATPLWYYALGATSPPVAVCLAVAAVFTALVPGRLWLAGLLLGFSSTLRDETLALAPGILLIHLYRHRTLKPALFFCAGIAVPVAAVAAIDAWVYGRPPAAHLLHALKGSWFSETPAGPVTVLEAMTLPQRFDAVFVYWLDGRTRLHVAWIAAGVVLAGVVKYRWNSYWGTVPLLAFVASEAIRDVAALHGAPRRLAGLLRLSPFIVFAALPAPGTATQRQRRSHAQVIAAVFVLVAVATTNTTGGKSLGPRLLLPAWPLLAFAAWAGIRQHLAARRESRLHAALGVSGLALIALSAAISSVLIMPAFRAVESDASAVARYVAQAPEPVVTIGSPFAIDPVIASYTEKAVLLVSSPRDASDIAERLRRARVRSLLAIHRDDRDDVVASFDGFDMVDERKFGRWIARRWAR